MNKNIDYSINSNYDSHKLSITILLHRIYRRVKRQLFPTKIYVKNIPLFLNNKFIYSFKLFTRYYLFIILILFLSLLLINNYIISGISSEYTLFNTNKNISDIGPSDRVELVKINNENIIEQKDDVVYFSTNMPINFDRVSVKVIFNNPNSDQEYKLGYRNVNDEYNTQVIDSPLLNVLDWKKIGSNPVLYQRKSTYTSVNQFLNNLPKNAIIGTYNYEIPQTLKYKNEDTYKPSNTATEINLFLRGAHTIYAYLNNERFKLEVQKQDLNWYKGEDPLSIKIYKDNTLVDSQIIEDDGIDDNSGKAGPIQSISIQNPKPENADPGIYKIVFDTSSDVIIRQIKTNLHKIIFQSPIFLADNSDVYGSIVKKTKPTTLFSNGQIISAIAMHEPAIQNISVGSKSLTIPTTQFESSIVPSEDLYSIKIPKNDLIISAKLGFFSVTSDQFFNPISYNILPIKSTDDVELTDYIIAGYDSSKSATNWKSSYTTFNLTDAAIDNKQLRWILQSPHLKENGNKIYIKNIEMFFHKKPVF